MANIAGKTDKTRNTPPPKDPPRPAIRPPATIGSSAHGPGDGKPQSELQGSARLRSILSLSVDVAIEQVCDEAATMIDTLRSSNTAADTSRHQRED